MTPRHTLLRITTALAVTIAVCVAQAAHRKTPTEQTLDSLFYAARYDTLRTIIPGLIRAAEARGDSASLGRLAFQNGRVEITLGHQAVADRNFDRAIRLTEAARDTAGLLPALHFKGFVLRDQGKVDPAMVMFTRERDLGRLSHDAAGEANATFNLAYKDLKRGDLAAARAGYWKAMELFRRTGDPYQVAIGTNSLGNLYRALGDPDSARMFFHQTLRIGREHNYPFHQLWALNNLGVLERDVGSFETALECDKEALAIGRRISFDRGIALPALNEALVLSYMGRSEEAFALLDECLAVCKRAGFKDLAENSAIAAGDLNLGAGRSNRAAAYYRRVLNQEFVFEKLRVAEAANGLAMALAQMDSVQQGIDVLTPYVSPHAAVTNYTEQAFFELDYIDLLRRAGRYQESLDRIAVVRDGLDRQGRTDLGVVARLMESDCRRRLGDGPRAADALFSALDSLEVARTEVGRADFREAYGVHLMSEVIDGCRVVLEYPPDASWPDRVHKFYDSLQRFKTRTLLDRIKDPRGKESIANALARPITLATLQGHVLRRGELLLDIVVGGDRSYMFAVTTDSCRLVTLPGWRAPLRQQVALYSELLAEPAGALRGDYPSARITTPQRVLGDAVLGSVADLVADADCIMVAPDGYYAAIPFGTLARGDGEMLLESRQVIDVPSASVLEWSREGTAGVSATPASMVAVEGGSAAGLAGARREVDALQKRYANVTLITAAPGVLDTLVQRAQPGCILHVAAHARVSDESPWQSGFLLDPGTSELRGAARGNDAPRGETVLRAWEIARAHLPYEMAVLAGCETAGGVITGGEGVLGLTSAFLSAGVPVVVSTRWDVDDHATADLMGHFYDGLSHGKNVAMALRDAQLAVRSNPRTSHPFYWAGFSVVGDGSRVISPLRLTGGKPVWPKLLMALGVAFIAVGWLVSRRRTAPAPAA